MNKNNRMEWISCDGGPHILMEKRCMQCWEGSEIPSNGRKVNAKFKWNPDSTTATDYDLVCDINDYIGIIETQNGSAIVINDDVPMSAFVFDKKNTGHIVVLYTWENEKYSEEIPDIINNMSLNDFDDSGIRYQTTEQILYHFPACDIPMKPVYGFAEISMMPGAFKIFRRDALTIQNGKIRIFRFQRE